MHRQVYIGATTAALVQWTDKGEREPPPHIIASVVEARAFYGIRRGEHRVYYKILCRFLGGLAGKMRKTTRSSSDSLLR